MANQGSTGSSKTYSIAQVLVTKAFEETGNTFTILRKSLPDLKASAMRDFFSVLNLYGLYNEKSHNKTDNIYWLRGNRFEFIGLDQPTKVRSRRRQYLWMNEVNEFSLEDWRQLSMRTEKQIFLDYNPSEEYSWLYDEVLTRDDCELIISTFRDNPFLNKDLVHEIESYRDKDPNYWRVYGLGQRGVSMTKIYPHWQYCDSMPEGGERIFGLDYGFNHPTALVEVRLKDEAIYADEKIYQRFLNNAERIALMKQLVESGELTFEDYIYADSAEPEFIKEMQEAGFNVIGADKEQGSVHAGIDEIKKRAFYITKRSVNTIKEVKMYSWKTKQGEVPEKEEPVKIKDDAMDAIRYPVYSYYKSMPVVLEWA